MPAPKLLTFETGREEKMIIEYWVHEQQRCVSRCKYLLVELFKDVELSKRHFFGLSELHSAIEDLNNTSIRVENLEWRKRLRENDHWIGVDHVRDND